MITASVYNLGNEVPQMIRFVQPSRWMVCMMMDCVYDDTLIECQNEFFVAKLTAGNTR